MLETSELVTLLVAAIGGGGFTALVTGVLNRRQVSATADATVGAAWQQFVQERKAEVELLKREHAETRGELKAAQQSISRLERHENDSLLWQARVLQRDVIVASLLEAQGIRVPPMPEPPAMRPRLTRAEDRN